MNAPVRPKDECRRVQHEGAAVSPPGRTEASAGLPITKVRQ